MIDYARARELANEFLSTLRVPERSGSVMLLESETLERPLGWVFFYTSTLRPGFLVGNSPFMIDRYSGRVHLLGTALPVEDSLPELERKLAAELGRISRDL